MSDKTFDKDASDRRPVIKIKPVSAFSFGFKEDRCPFKIKLLSHLIGQITAITKMQPLRSIHDQRDTWWSDIVLRCKIETDIHTIDTWQCMLSHCGLNHFIQLTRRNTL